MAPLLHRQADAPWGCLYYALHAHLQDDTLLDFIDDVSEARWRIRALERGVMIVPWYADQLQHCWPDTWHDLIERSSGSIPLLITVSSKAAPGSRHIVACKMRVGMSHEGITFEVSDASQPEAQHFATLDEFLSSRYARAYQIETLISTDMEAHPFEPAGEALEAARVNQAS